MEPASYPGALVLIHAAHAKVTQALRLDIAPGYEAGNGTV
jgi:hypothetical protein